MSTTTNATLLVTDPYRAWLGVQAANRPLNAYQLLGIRIGETDLKAIEEAGERQRSRLLGMRREAHPLLWRSVSEELDAALASLANPQRKAEYDQKLGVLGGPVDSKGSAAAREEGVTCRQCGKTNGGDRNYCATCGDPLMQPCPRCGVHTAADEAFCGVCGVRVQQAIEERVREYEDRLDRAEELQREGHFDAAMVLLATFASTNLEQLEGHVAQMHEALERLSERREDVGASAQRAFYEALAASKQYDYKTALSLLGAVPEGALTEPMRQLLEEVRTSRREVSKLKAVIRDSLAYKKYEGLLEKVDRLLQLQPNNEQALELREQLRNREAKADQSKAAALLARAKKAAHTHQHQAAFELLESVPEIGRDAEFQKLHDYAAEAAWLAADLKHSPLLDAVLPHVAERFAKIAPQDPQTTKITKEIHRRAKEPPHGRLAGPQWTATPQRTRLGCDVQWIGGFRQLAIDEAVETQSVREAPGRFYVACGLALQALGRAPVATNLQPKSKGGLFGKFSLLPRRRGEEPPGWGIDLGPGGLKAVQLKTDQESGRLKITQCALLEHKLEAAAGSVLEQPSVAVLRDTLARFLELHDVSKSRVCVGSSDQQVLGRFFPIPRMDSAQYAAAIQHELPHQVPFAADELLWDFRIVEPEDESAGQCEAILLACKRFGLESYLRVFEELKVDVHAVQCDSAALHNFMHYEFHDELSALRRINRGGERGRPRRGLAMLDIGAHSTNLVVSDGVSFWFRNVRIGGVDFTKALVRGLHLTTWNAEQIKVKPQQTASFYRWDRSLAAPTRRLLTEIQRSLMAAKQWRVETILASGGGMQLHGLLRRLLHGFDNSV